MYTYKEAKLKTVYLVLCSISTILVRTKYMCMYKLQNVECVISVIPHMSLMLLYLYLKLVFHNVKMSHKIHAND